MRSQFSSFVVRLKTLGLRARFWSGQRGFWLWPPLAALCVGLSAIAFRDLTDRARLLSWFLLPASEPSGSIASFGASLVAWLAAIGGLICAALAATLFSLLRGQRQTPEKEALEAKIQAMGAPARAKKEAEALRAALPEKNSPCEKRAKTRPARRL